MTDPLCRAIAHLTCRERYPKWDALLCKMSAGKTKAQKMAIFSEDLANQLANRRKAPDVVKETGADEDADLFPTKGKG